MGYPCIRIDLQSLLALLYISIGARCGTSAGEIGPELHRARIPGLYKLIRSYVRQVALLRHIRVLHLDP
jgi:hypothetical protein